MNEDMDVAGGRLLSLADMIRTLLKSRFRVSSIPMTCIPEAGSPWKGMDLPFTICLINRPNVWGVTMSSPDSNIVVRREMSV